MFNNKLALAGAALTVLFTAAPTLSAATPPPMTTTDVYQANYFLGLHNPDPAPGNDATIAILDPGTNGSANLCADIYVLNPSEELEACCSCTLTPDEILTGPVVEDLLSNNVSPIWLANGVLKIISDSKCNAANPTPTPNMRAWLTRVDNTNSTTGTTTTPFASATLSVAERNSLATRCGDIIAVGSGYGVCACPTEPPNNGNGNSE